MTKQSHGLTVAEQTQTYLLGIVHFGQVTKDNNIKMTETRRKKSLPYPETAITYALGIADFGQVKRKW